MRRLMAIGALALLMLAAAVPLTSADTTPVTVHVDGTITTSEFYTNHVWIARFEARTTPAGDVQFGYLELYGIGGDVKGQIHEFTIKHVRYFTDARGKGAAFDVSEYAIIPADGYLGTGGDVYVVTDGAAVGKPDTFVAGLGWTRDSGNISIYSTGGGNQQ